MKHDMKTIREALRVMYGQADETWEQEKVLSTALDELEALRDATSPVPGLADSGPYSMADVEAIEKHRRKPYARLRETVLELDAAKADAAQLRIDALRLTAVSQRVVERATMSFTLASEFDERIFAVRAALAATDSAEWLREVMERCVDAAVDATMTALPACADCGSRRDKAYERIDPSAIIDEVLRGGA